MLRPIAVLISDVHYNLQTMHLADMAMESAINEANKLRVRLIVAGDLHDTKAIIRGECQKMILDRLHQCIERPIIIRGNHDSINEKSTEHSLEFLRYIADIVNDRLITLYVKGVKMYFMAYYHDPEKFASEFKHTDKGSIVIMHQGVTGALPGEYSHDKSAVSAALLSHRKVISGHYHIRQTISLEGGSLNYLGNPFTLNFGEASHPDKGFHILYEDGSLKFIPLNLRRHRVIEYAPGIKVGVNKNDLFWVKVKGSRQDLKNITKDSIREELGLPDAFKLDFTILDEEKPKVSIKSSDRVLDDLIDNMDIDKLKKDELKYLWRQFI